MVYRNTDRLNNLTMHVQLTYEDIRYWATLINLCPIFSDNFYEQDTETQGVVCVFSLKNPSYPEYLCIAQSGVLCIDIHPQHPHMLVAGLSNGNVAVYNLQKKIEGRPSYISTARNGKHQDGVGQVCV